MNSKEENLSPNYPITSKNSASDLYKILRL
jgi:hypothetical protein